MSKSSLEENVEKPSDDNTSSSSSELTETELNQLNAMLEDILSRENTVKLLLDSLSKSDREQLKLPLPSKWVPEFIAAKELEEIWGNYFRQNEEEIKAKSTDKVELPPSFTEGLYSDKKRDIVDSFLSAIGLRSYK